MLLAEQCLTILQDAQSELILAHKIHLSESLEDLL